MTAIASPCVGVCKIDPSTGYCLGCARTGDEIAWWWSGSSAARTEVWNALPQRFDRLGVSARRTPWGAAEIIDFVEQSIDVGAPPSHKETASVYSGTWALGVLGAVGEFNREAGEPIDIRRWEREHEIGVDMATPRAALRVRADDEIRAMRIETPERAPRTVLAVKKERGALPASGVLRDLGEDAAAISAEHRSERLFDFGVGRAAARFCVRTGDPAVAAALEKAAGQHWSAWLGALGRLLVEASPTRVIETRLGRVEISTPIPPPGGASPMGPHTHFLPNHLALGLDAPADLHVPERYVPGATFYPRSAPE